MITNVVAGQSVGNIITFHLLTVMAVYAALIFAARRNWIKPNEIWLLGGAILFWAASWLLGPVIPVVRSRFPGISSAIPISIGLILPVIIAMALGIVYLRKKMILRMSDKLPSDKMEIDNN